MPEENEETNNSDFIVRVKVDGSWYPIVGIATNDTYGVVKLSDTLLKWTDKYTQGQQQP